MKLKYRQWNDLATLLDNIPPKEFSSHGDMRKNQGAVTQIRTGIVDFLAEYEALKAEYLAIDSSDAWKDLLKSADPFLVNGKEKDDPESKAELAKLNEKGVEMKKEVNAKSKELNEKYKDKESEIELNPEYLNFIKQIWDKNIRPQYFQQKECLVIADALGI